jgi:hypothetical protein
MASMSAHHVDEQQSLRELTFPEEDRHLYTTAPWKGGYRWFRSPNIIPIEQCRQSGTRSGQKGNCPPRTMFAPFKPPIS